MGREKMTFYLIYNNQRIDTIILKLETGIGGNLYVRCDDEIPLLHIVDKINKSRNSVYFNKKYKVWVIRCKSTKHKLALRTLFKKIHHLTGRKNG